MAERTRIAPDGAGGDVLSEEYQARRLAERLSIEFVDLDNFEIDPELFREIPVDLMFRYNFVPRRPSDYRGITLEEMDVDAVLARRPQLALVDELAHTNAAGSRHPKRYQDIEELLAAGIDVAVPC